MIAQIDSRASVLVIASGLALATLAVYAAGLHGPFLMDDFESVLPLAAHQASGASWMEVLRDAPSALRMRWLSNVTFLLTRQLAGNPVPIDTFSFKAGNLGVHIACAVLVGALARRVARAWDDDARRTTFAALLAAGLFALHPLLVSTVLYPVQRAAQLSTLFLLAACLAYLRWRQEFLQWTPRRSAANVSIIAGLSVIAVLSKENGVLAPLLFLVLELTTLRAPDKGHARRREYEIGVGLLCGAPLALGVLGLAAQWQQIVGGYANRDFTLTQRLFTEMHVLVDYLAQVLWPRIGGMGLYRDDFPLTESFDAATGLVIVGWAAAFGATAALRRRLPVIAFALGWFLAAHVLESTIVALELVFEHRNYLALPGIAIGVAWCVARLPPRYAVLAAAILSVPLAAQTARRVHDWSNYDRFIRSEVAHHPSSLRASSDLVGHLAATGRQDEARLAADAMSQRFSTHAHPVIVRLWPECGSASPATVGIDLQRLREGRIDKSSLHLFAGLRDRKLAGHCDRVPWASFADVAAAAGANPRWRKSPRDALSWARLRADTAAAAQDWAQVREAIDGVLRVDDSRLEDWLLRLRSAAMLRDAVDYRQVRGRLLQLAGGRPETLGPEFAEIEAILAPAG